MSKTLNMITAKKGGGVTASIKVLGDISSTDTCYATLGAKTKQGVWTTVPNPALHNLPSGYTELKYIESSGTQYIDTGIILVNPTVEIDFELTAYKNNGGIFGVRDSWYGGGCEIWQTGTQNYDTGYGNNYYSIPISTELNKRHFYVLDRGSVNFDGIFYTSLSGGSPSTTKTCPIFTNYTDGTLVLSQMKLYSFRIYNNGTLVFDGIPCKNSLNEIGLYDLVSQTFFGNDGTGAFTAGAEVPQTVYGWLIKGITDYGTWTVHWSDGVRTVEEDVLIDVITEYTVLIE